ncbi:putative pectinesterase [Trifolium repens]|nr:putative pectinesterase [Trifolium repens]
MQGCTIESTAQNLGYITAQDRSSLSMESGFSITNSHVQGSGQVYLGRPWGVNSRVIYSYTSMTNIVLPQGWEDTMYTNRSLTVYYGEYKCSGPGSNLAGRPPWVHRLTDQEAKEFIGTQFIYGDTWIISPSL